MIKIEGKIAAILGNNEVVINRGSMHLVKEGMVFGIKLLIPDIVDPDDPFNVLRGFYYTKGKIRIEKVLQKMSFGSIQPRIIFKSASTALPIDMFTEKREYPEVLGAKLIGADDWKIKEGDQVYLIEEKEK